MPISVITYLKLKKHVDTGTDTLFFTQPILQTYINGSTITAAGTQDITKLQHTAAALDTG